MTSASVGTLADYAPQPNLYEGARHSFFGEMLTATVMGFFEAQIERAVVRPIFLPLVISSSVSVVTVITSIGVLPR